MKFDLINHEVLDFQLASKQPSLWMVFGTWILILSVVRAFSLVPVGGDFAVLRAECFAETLLLCIGAALWLNRRFPTALETLHKKHFGRWKYEAVTLILASPLVVGQVLPILELHNSFLALFAFTKGNPTTLRLARDTWISFHERLWEGLGYGTDLHGVLLGSLNVLLIPIFEERFFRGYMLTSACRYFRPLVAVGLVALLFALAHLLITQSVLQLGRVFWMGVCCGLIRMQRGRWTDAMLLHLFLNFCFLAPRFYVALIRFWVLDT